MSFVFELITASLFGIIDIYCIYRLLNNNLKFRFSREKIVPVYMGIYILYILAQALGFFLSYPVKLPLMLLFFILLFVIYSEVFYKKLYWIFCVVLLLSTTFPRNIPQTMSDYCMEMLLSRILLFISTLFVACFSRPNHTKKRSFRYKEISVIIFIDGFYFSLLFNLYYYHKSSLDTGTSIALSVFVLVVISVLSVYLLQKIAKKSEEIMNTTLKLQQAEIEHKLTSDMTSVVENLRSLRHDMNNHMSILQGLLSVGAYDDMEAYLNSLTQELSVANNFYFTENKVLSVLLNSKISKAAQLGITFETEILTSETPFSERDLCTVIGNVLENAIEASSKHAEPCIYFAMYQEQQQLHIQCDNTYTTAPVFENGRLLTTKEDKATHGIGTQNICSIVEAYHGTVRFSVDERFHVAISIPV